MITSFERYDTATLEWAVANLAETIESAAANETTPMQREFARCFAPLRERCEAELLRRGVTVREIV